MGDRFEGRSPQIFTRTMNGPQAIKGSFLRHLILIVALLMLALTACPERAPPEAAQIECTADADCPENWACREDGEGESRCVQVTGGDADDTGTSGKDDDAGPTDTSETCAEAEEHGIGVDASEIFCELVDMIEAADLNQTERDDLMDCLPEMSEEEWADMLSDWSSMSDDEVRHEMRVLSWTDCETRDDSDLH